MSSKSAISLKGIAKKYQIYENPKDRLRSMLPWNKNKVFGHEFWALEDINLEITQGEVVGLIGRNGAGKSTLLQLICKTLSPSEGTLKIDGKVAALLELGSGFNPEFTGRENVFLAAAIAGMGKSEIASKYDEIVAFSEIEEFIDQPVKTYSSGMMVRLAFSVATSVNPDILVIDEALSVGDGAFARKSFSRIMNLKEAGTTILLCSHSMHQIEMLCSKVLWIDKGKIRSIGMPHKVITEYTEYLNKIAEKNSAPSQTTNSKNASMAKIKTIKLFCDNHEEEEPNLTCNENDLSIVIEFESDPTIPAPNIAVTFDTADFRMATSMTSLGEMEIVRAENGEGKVKVVFPKIQLLRGKYFISVYLMCEKCIFFYDSRPHLFVINVEQKSFEQGIFRMEREWYQ